MSIVNLTFICSGLLQEENLHSNVLFIQQHMSQKNKNKNKTERETKKAG